MAKIARGSQADGRTRYKKQLWGGFIAGKLDTREMDTGWGGFGSGDGMRRIPAIFTSRTAARKEYQDVRPVEIRELS
jgi:hypothetical protein